MMVYTMIIISHIILCYLYIQVLAYYYLSMLEVYLKQSRRAILFVMISLVLIFSATIYTYASLILFIMDFINIYITYSRLSSF